MLYSEYITKAKNACIEIDEQNDTAYLIPDYRYVLSMSELKLEDVTDFEGVNMDIVRENLELEVKAYNARHNLVPALALFAKDFIFTELSPLLVQEQNELFANMIEYMKANNDKHSLAEAEATKEEPQEEKHVDIEAELGSKMNMFDFSRKPN